VSLREMRAALENELALRGIEVVSGDIVERYLVKNRIRYTGGVDRAAAQAAANDMGVDGLLVSSIELYVPQPIPKLALTARLVAARADAALLWVDAASRTGDESPGLLALGLVRDYGELQHRVLGSLAESLRAFLDGEGPRAPECPDGRRYRPRVPYRSPTIGSAEPPSIAVVPFRNLTDRPSAGDLVSLTFVRQLAAVPGFRIVEPGVVRQALLRGRIVMEGGVSLDQVRTFIGTVEADLVVAGDVFEYADGAMAGVPLANFNVTVLETRSGKIAWQSTSYNRGDDGVAFFDLGRISTATALTCRMVRSAVDGMLGGGGGRQPALAAPATRGPSEVR
jgi:hypothetical protein